jgi:hypothetical protein
MEVSRFGGERTTSSRLAHTVTHYQHSENVYFNHQQIIGHLVFLNILLILVSGLFGMEAEHKIVVHIKELGKRNSLQIGLSVPDFFGFSLSIPNFSCVSTE